MESYGEVKIAPSLLAADFTRLSEQIQAAESGGADLLHYDVMDGRFVPNITMGAFILKQIRQITIGHCGIQGSLVRQTPS